MSREIYSVVYKKLVPPSGDPHDYMTMGTYWWPDPSKPEGLPYIRRDGYVNKEAQDRNTYAAMATAVSELAHAAYLFERRDLGERSLEFLAAWHIDEKTRMNPHAEYAQAIPGICEGRGIGIIDIRMSYKIFDATEILYALGIMNAEQYAAIKKWYVDFVNWLITSEKGIFEDNYFNNHGCWYDVQVLSAAIFTGRSELARRVAMNSYRRRHKMHINADGKQPHELERTQAMSYSVMNLLGLSIIAGLSVPLGYREYIEVDAEADDILLAKAAEFLYPYTKDQSEFPYAQIHHGDFGREMSQILTILYELTGNVKQREMLKKIEDAKYLTNLIPMQ